MSDLIDIPFTPEELERRSVYRRERQRLDNMVSMVEELNLEHAELVAKHYQGDMANFKAPAKLDASTAMRLNMSRANLDYPDRLLPFTDGMLGDVAHRNLMMALNTVMAELDTFHTDDNPRRADKFAPSHMSKRNYARKVRTRGRAHGAITLAKNDSDELDLPQAA